jgi:hypothetical protein
MLSGTCFRARNNVVGYSIEELLGITFHCASSTEAVVLSLS